MTDTTDQPVSHAQPERESGRTGTTPMPGFGQYVELVRHQMDLHREFTLTWATALTSVSAAVLGQWHTVERILAGQADQLAQHAHGAERVARGLTEQVVIAEKTLSSWVDRRPAASEAVDQRIPTQRTGPQRAANPGQAPRAANQRTATQRAATQWTATHRSATAQPGPTAGEPDQLRTTPDIFDELIELIVDEDIKAAIQ